MTRTKTALLTMGTVVLFTTAPVALILAAAAACVFLAPRMIRDRLGTSAGPGLPLSIRWRMILVGTSAAVIMGLKNVVIDGLALPHVPSMAVAAAVVLIVFMADLNRAKPPQSSKRGSRS